MGKRDVFKSPVLRAYLSYDPDLVSDATGLDCSKNDPNQDVQEAHQEFKDECDINKIIEKYDKLKAPLPLSNPAEWAARCGDISGLGEYHEMLNSIRAAEESFMELPARVRARFENDPGKMLEFVNDGSNRKEAEELGLLVRSSGGVDKGVSGKVPGLPKVEVPPAVKPV